MHLVYLLNDCHDHESWYYEHVVIYKRYDDIEMICNSSNSCIKNSEAFSVERENV